MKRKIVYGLISLLAAFAIWAYVITEENPESTGTFYNVPVVLQGESLLTERGLMLTDGGNASITLEVYGNRKYLNKLKSSDITVTADLTKIYGPGLQNLTYDISYPGDIPNNALSTQSRKPDLISVNIARRITKNVDVEVDFTGSVPEDFLADKENPVLDYPQISVTGPEEVVSQIDHAYIEVDLTARTESISESFRYTLCDAEGEPVDVAQVTTNVEEVRLEVRIQRRKLIQLVMNVVPGGGATEKTSKITIDPQTIWVSGNDLVLNDLDTLELGTLNLAELTTDTTSEFDIVLPEGITNVSGQEKATVSVSFPELATREVTVSVFKAVNVPEGMVVDFLTTQLKVTVRGPKNRIAALKASDITVTVDFAGEEAGSTTLKAEITLSDNFKDCGALNSGSVSATIRPADEEPT